MISTAPPPPPPWSGFKNSSILDLTQQVLVTWCSISGMTDMKDDYSITVMMDCFSKRYHYQLPVLIQNEASGSFNLGRGDLSFRKNEGSKNLKLMEKGVNWIENERKIYTKCLKSVK